VICITSKKGAFIPTLDAIELIIKTGVISLLFVLFIFVVASGSSKNVPKGLDDILDVQRVVTNCFARYDPISERNYPLEIDMTKFNEDSLGECYNVDKESRQRAYTLKLKDAEIKTRNFDGLPSSIFTKKVLVDGKIEILTFEVQNE